MPVETLSRTGAVAMAIRTRIAERRLGAGDRLPSIRRLAQEMRVSPSTVVEAYDRLLAEGLIRSRPGSGFFVSAVSAPRSLAEAEPRPEPAIDPFWVSRQSLDADPAQPKPGCGWMPAGWMPNPAIRKALRALARAPESLLADYGQTRGSLPLRRLLARQLAGQDIATGADQLMLTASGTRAIDLVCRLLLRPGDTVLVDDPCYFNFQALLTAHRAQIVAIPYTPEGPDPEAFAAAAAGTAPRLYITNSALHNPTGATMTPRIAHRILGLAAAHDVVVVEDDIFGDLEPEPSVRLASLDGLSRVIRIGSFSKTLSASVRCGYVAARPDWIEALIDLQVATSFGGPSPLAAELVLQVLGDGGYRRHLDGLHRRLAALRAEVAERLAGLGITPWLVPRGGFLLWCRLPEGVDSADLARLALARGLVLAPGDVFSPTRSAAAFMRFNVTQMGGQELWRTLAEAMQAARR
ncbi:PLP-dependent aminotransferase family protein [Bosea sp. TWI1241]|uniref:aminotransferase-like domain-containing protein n=1 Tax=Bosea sp. TWI1241 TaxID=3148904 RepID=UPI00320B67E5